MATDNRKEVSINRKEFVFVPKENGYSYMVCVAFTIMLLTLYAPLNSFGILYRRFIDEESRGIRGITLFSGISSIIVSFSGIFASAALKKFSLRKLAIFGAIFYSLGCFLTTFVNDAYQMILTFSLIQGMGLGTLTTVSYTCFNKHFIQKKVMLMSWCQVVKGFGSMAHPLFLSFFQREYGDRGAFLIISAIAFHTIFAAIAMHPVDWYADKKYLYNAIPQVDDTKNILMKERRNYQCVSEKTLVSTSKAMKNDDDEKRHNKIGIWRKIINTFDLDLFSDIYFVNIITGISIMLFTDAAFLSIFPFYLYSINFNESQVATCVVVLGGGEMVGKLCLAIISKYIKLKSRNIFFVGIIGTTIMRLVFIECSCYISLIIAISILGVLKGTFICCPLIYSEYNPEKFSAAFSLSVLLTGWNCTLFIPMLGFVRDYAGSYLLIFFLLAIIPIVPISLWGIEFIHFKRKQSKAKSRSKSVY